jgi:hypothetical protein
METCTRRISTTKLKIENYKIIHYNDKNNRNMELESSVVYIQVTTTGNSLPKTGAKIQPLPNALKIPLTDFHQNYLIHCIDIEFAGIIGNYDVKS